MWGTGEKEVAQRASSQGMQGSSSLCWPKVFSWVLMCANYLRPGKDTEGAERTISGVLRGLEIVHVTRAREERPQDTQSSRWKPQKDIALAVGLN